MEFRETELQRRVKQSGGKWNSAKRVWEIHYDKAVALDLKKRLVKLDVSDIRHWCSRMSRVLNNEVFFQCSVGANMRSLETAIRSRLDR